MIKTRERLFRNLVTPRQKDLPREPVSRVVNVAAIALGVLRRKSLQMGQIVTSLPLPGTRDSLKKRVQRFLKNPEVAIAVYQEPLARRLLKRLVVGGARVPLILDRTEWGLFNILSVSVGWRGRALPLVWGVLRPGASSFAQQQELLEVVGQWVPKGARVMVLGDRECGTGVLAQFALAQGWGVCLRVKSHEHVRPAHSPSFDIVPPVKLGQRRFWSGVHFTQKHAVAGLNLAMYWAPTAREPWYLITTEPTCKQARATYHTRFRIEDMCKDFKNNGRGFGLELTGLRHPERLQRLLLALALIYTWVVLWDAQVIATGEQKVVDNVRKPTLSLFQTGLRFLQRLRDQGQLVRFQWHWPVLTETNS